MITYILRVLLLLPMMTFATLSHGQQFPDCHLGAHPRGRQSLGLRYPIDHFPPESVSSGRVADLQGDVTFTSSKSPHTDISPGLPQTESDQVIGGYSDDWEPAAVSHQEWARQGAWEECEPRFRLSEFNIYPTFSYQGNLSATYTEFEFASHTDLGCIEMENRTVLNVADLPSSISLGPTNPSAADTVDVRASGFGDVLSGFFFSRKDTRHKWHLGIGPVFTFPSATDEILGSGNWTVGPGAHFSTEMGNLTAGFFLWQSWTFAQDPSRKPVNQLFGKPFFIYDVNKKWDLVYIPLGLSMSWDAPSGEQWTVPLGGGVRRLFKLCDQQMGFQVQVFDYVAQKKSDPDWELRMTIEFLFDE